MNEKLLEGILMQLGQLNATMTDLATKVEKYAFDLNEFSDRFEEVVTQLEDERRLDLLGEFN